MPKKEKPLIHLTGQKMPLPVEIIEKSRPSWKGWILGDMGDVFYIAFREGSGEKNPQQLVQISKSMIVSIKIIEPPFELLNDVDVKQMINRFGAQWDHDYFKTKSRRKNKW